MRQFTMRPDLYMEELLSPTPYVDVNVVLRGFLDQIRSTLDAQFRRPVSVWITGAGRF